MGGGSIMSEHPHDSESRRLLKPGSISTAEQCYSGPEQAALSSWDSLLSTLPLFFIMYFVLSPVFPLDLCEELS